MPSSRDDIESGLKSENAAPASVPPSKGRTRQTRGRPAASSSADIAGDEDAEACRNAATEDRSAPGPSAGLKPGSAATAAIAPPGPRTPMETTSRMVDRKVESIAPSARPSIPEATERSIDGEVCPRPSSTSVTATSA